MSEQFVQSDGLIPQGTIELSGAIQKLLDRRGQKSGQFEQWTPECKASLVSAMTGGQWTQSRLATQGKWTEDALCQLCKSDIGNIAHRRQCPQTLPTGGWSMPSKNAGKFIARFDRDRHRTALDHGLVLTRILLVPPPIDECFQWFLRPPEPFDSSWTWYIDGSHIGGRLPGAGRTGFAVVIVAFDGSLVAYGNGHPPDWIVDASGAEAWALFIALRLCSFFPQVITDCFNLLKFIEEGPQAAGASHKPLARLWNMIFPLCDSMSTECIANRLLIWMPAHKSTSAIGTCIRSDGRFVSAIDWRANRLVDYLARLAAMQHASPDLASYIYKQALQAAEYCAAYLGTVTHKANNHSMPVLKPNGSVVFSCHRDSAPGKRPSIVPDESAKRMKPSETISAAESFLRGTKRGIGEVSDPTPLPLQPSPVCTRYAVPSSVRTRTALCNRKHKQAENAHRAQCEDAFWSNWNENRSTRPPNTKPKISGADKLAAIRLRLRGSPT